MRKQLIGSGLKEILLEHLKQISLYSVVEDVPQELLEDYINGNRRIFSEQEREKISQYILSKLFQIYLEQKDECIFSDNKVSHAVVQIAKQDPTAELMAYEEYYAFKFLNKLDDVARRAQTVREMFVETDPSQKVVGLATEVYQTYILGHHLASVALLRTLVESALKELLGVDLSARDSIKELLRHASKKGLIDAKTGRDIDKVYSFGNSCLHRGRFPSEEENLEIIKIAQRVLKQLIQA